MRLNKSTIKMALFAALLMLPGISFAGGLSDGGEHSVGEVPIELSHGSGVGKNSRLINPQVDLPAFQKDIVPLLSYLGRTLPSFKAPLESALNKKWYLTTERLRPCAGGDTMIDAPLIVRACQDDEIVIMDENWLLRDGVDENGEAVSAELKQKVTIVHEMARNLVLQNKSIKERNLETLVRLLLGFEGPLPNETSLAETVEKLGFGKYLPYSIEKDVEAFSRRVKEISPLCKPESKTANTLQKLRRCDEALDKLGNLEDELHNRAWYREYVLHRSAAGPIHNLVDNEFFFARSDFSRASLSLFDSCIGTPLIRKCMAYEDARDRQNKSRK